MFSGLNKFTEGCFSWLSLIFLPLSPKEYLYVNQENVEMTFVQC